MKIQIIFGTLLILLLEQAGFCFPTIGGEPQDVKDVFLQDGDRVRVEPWIGNLEIPWALIFLPDGRALVSERPGRIRVIKDGKLQAAPYLNLDVHHSGEGGLMGLARRRPTVVERGRRGGSRHGRPAGLGRGPGRGGLLNGPG